MQCPWGVKCRVRGGLTLEDVCRTLPSMSSLQVVSRRLGAIMLEPAAKLSALTKLQLVGEILYIDRFLGVEPFVDLGHLPSALEELSLTAIYAEPTYYRRIYCSHLTRLEVKYSQHTAAEIAELLSHLPALKV